MMSWSGTLASPRWSRRCAGGGGAPARRSGPAGRGSDHSRGGPGRCAGRCGGALADGPGRIAFGQEQRSARTRSAAGQAQLAREQAGGAGVPVHPLDRAAFGTGWAPGGCPGRGPARRSRGSPPRGPRSRTASAAGSSRAAGCRGVTAAAGPRSSARPWSRRSFPGGVRSRRGPRGGPAFLGLVPGEPGGGRLHGPAGASAAFDTRMHMDSLVVMSRRFREASAGLLSGSAVQSQDGAARRYLKGGNAPAVQY